MDRQMRTHTPMLAGLLLLAVSSQVFAQERHIVRVRSDAAVDISSLAGKYGLRVLGTVRQSEKDQVYIIEAPDGAYGQNAIDRLSKDSSVVTAERDEAVALPLVTMKKGAAPPKLNMRTLLNLKKSRQVSFFGTAAWNGYTLQPAANLIRLDDSRKYATGSGIVAVIDTGVDFSHPVLAPALTLGWDFTRGTAGGSEESDINDQEVTPILDDQEVTPILDAGGIAIINDQEVTPILDDQEVTPILDDRIPAALGHGTMTAGIIHLVAPTAQIMPLKAFKSDGTGKLSDIVQAIYYAVDHGASVISMSFDTKQGKGELRNAIDYATEH